MELEDQIAAHESQGALDCSTCLGIVQMPTGYALMINSDRSHYYWLRHDGVESVIDWNRWRVRAGAIINAAKAIANQQP